MIKVSAPALIALVAMAGAALAQTAAEPQTRQERGVAQTPDRSGQPATAQRTQRTPGQAGQGASLDQNIAACLVLGNQQEIALAQFAQQRAQNEQVKEFAQMIVEEHQQANSKIEQATPEISGWNLELRTAGAARTTPQAGRPAGAAQARTQTAAGGGGAEQPMLAFVRKAHEECLSLTQQELGQKQGAEFDKAFMGHAYFAHVGALAKIRASKEFASEKLQPVLQEGEQMTQQHLAQAKQIKEQLKTEGGQRQTTLKPPTTGTAPAANQQQ